MTDAVIDAIDLVAQEDGPEAAAEQADHELGADEANEMLAAAANSSFGARHDRLLAVLSELRKLQEVEA